MILSDGGIAEHTILPDAGNGQPVYAGGVVKLPGAFPFAHSGLLHISQNHIAQPKLPHHLIRPGNGVLFGNAAPVGATVILEVAVDNCRVRPVPAEAVHDVDFVLGSIHGGIAADLIGRSGILKAVDDGLFLRCFCHFRSVIGDDLLTARFQLLRRLFRGVRVGVPFGGVDIINGILTLLLRHDSAVERLSLQKHPQ